MGMVFTGFFDKEVHHHPRQFAQAIAILNSQEIWLHRNRQYQTSAEPFDIYVDFFVCSQQISIAQVLNIYNLIEPC